MIDSALQRLIGRKIAKERMKTERSLSDEIISHPGQLRVHASLAILTKDIGEILDKHFHGWSWMVQPDERNQIINIWNLHLHDKWGYTIRTAEIHNDPKRRLAYVAGREILERFGFRPGPLDAHARQHLATAKRGSDGHVVPVDAWDRMTRQQRRQASVDETVDKMEVLIDGLQTKR